MFPTKIAFREGTTPKEPVVLRGNIKKSLRGKGEPIEKE